MRPRSNWDPACVPVPPHPLPADASRPVIATAHLPTYNPWTLPGNRPGAREWRNWQTRRT
jgi:hypothetical protein